MFSTSVNLAPHAVLIESMSVLSRVRGASAYDELGTQSPASNQRGLHNTVNAREWRGRLCRLYAGLEIRLATESIYYS